MAYRYRLILEYDGAFFVGWQQQAQGVSVQEVLKRAALNLTQEEVIFYGAGRTDKGVHARGQVAHVEFSKPWSLDALRRGLNFYLEEDAVRILKAEEVSASFDARFSAVFRRYHYLILNRPSPSVLEKNRLWWVPKPLDLEAMRQAASFLVGHHDFSSFRHRDCQSQSPFKTLDILTLEVCQERITLIAQARSFLHRQVRMMVGGLVQVGRGGWPPTRIKAMLQGEQGSQGLMTAPPWGLYLEKVGYGADKAQTEAQHGKEEGEKSCIERG